MAATATGDPTEFGMVLEHLSQSITDGLRSRTAVILGAAGTGKTYLLTQLLGRFPNRALMLDPPARAEDAAEFAVSQLADGLRTLGRLTASDHDELRDPSMRFEDKMRRLHRAANDPDLVLLCDGWGFWEQGATDEARARSVQVIDFLSSLNATRIVAGPIASAQAPPLEQFHLAQARDIPETYAAGSWGPLEAAAEAAAGQLAPRRRVSPLVFRLLVALTSLSSSVSDAPPNARKLGQLLHDTIPASSPLKTAWRSLAVLRAPADSTLIGAFVDHLATDERAIVKYCLLDRDDPRGGRLSSLLRQFVVARTSRALRERVPAHRTAAKRYEDVQGELLATFERFHHYGRAGDIDAALQYPLFQEQLHELGWWLSTARHNYRGAVDVFTRAIEQDPLDAYAHHYLAFNLDIQGRRWRDAQSAYTTALELQPQRAWSHSRYIRFLIALGRVDDARDAWDRAQLELGPPEAVGDWRFRYYSELHEDVASALLDVNEIEFALAVLRDVPSDVIDARPSLALLRRRAEKLALGRTQLARYLPIANLSRDAVTTGPFKLPQRLPGHDLGEWWAARIDGIEGGDALLAAAVIRPAASEVEEITAEVSVEQLHADAIYPLGEMQDGSFIEVGFYRRLSDPDSDPLVLTATNEDRDASDLAYRRPFPDTFRYARRTLSRRRRD